jgi:hypothetical protein
MRTIAHSKLLDATHAEIAVLPKLLSFRNCTELAALIHPGMPRPEYRYS